MLPINSKFYNAVHSNQNGVSSLHLTQIHGYVFVHEQCLLWDGHTNFNFFIIRALYMYSQYNTIQYYNNYKYKNITYNTMY